MTKRYSTKDVDKEQEQAELDALENLSQVSQDLQMQLNNALRTINNQLGEIAGLGAVYKETASKNGGKELVNSAQAEFVFDYLFDFTEAVQDVIEQKLTKMFGNNFFSPYVDSAYNKFFKKYPSE